MPTIPLHPMIVHFPIVLAVLLPFVAVGALWVIRSRVVRPSAAWAIPFLLTVALLGSAFVATRTGEAEEDRVEKVVPENVLHEHEEAAERFLMIAAVVAAIALLGLARGTVGTAARAVATVGSLVIVFAGFQVGKAGGELVYEHNAGAAYVEGGPNATKASGERVQANNAEANNEDSDKN
ncbi:MAG TPA: DUF2231 domain-containing protein [Longimicrobiales bacterium]